MPCIIIFTHTPVCVLGDKQKQKRYFLLLRDGDLMKVLLGNNLGYRLHSLISTKQTEERFSAGWTRDSGNKNVALNYTFSTIGFKDKNVSFSFKNLHMEPFYSCMFISIVPHSSVVMLTLLQVDVACSRAL